MICKVGLVLGSSFVNHTVLRQRYFYVQIKLNWSNTIGRTNDCCLKKVFVFQYWALQTSLN